MAGCMRVNCENISELVRMNQTRNVAFSGQKLTSFEVNESDLDSDFPWMISNKIFPKNGYRERLALPISADFVC